MLDMIGHVPGEEPHQPRGERGPGVEEHVGDFFAIAMLGQKVKPQERLAQQDRDNPDPQQDGRPQKRQPGQQIAKRHAPRFGNDPGLCRLWHIVALDPSPDQRRQKPHLRDPVRQARDMPDPGPQGLGLGRGKLGVAAVDVGPAMMRQVKGAEPFEWQQDQEPRKPADPVVQSHRPKGSAMRRLMLQREQKDDQHPLRRQKRPPARHTGRDQAANRKNGPKVQRQMPKPRPV